MNTSIRALATKLREIQRFERWKKYLKASTAMQSGIRLNVRIGRQNAMEMTKLLKLQG